MYTDAARRRPLGRTIVLGVMILVAILFFLITLRQLTGQ